MSELSDAAPLRLPRGAAFPGSPTQGDTFVLTTDGQAYVYDGTTWQSHVAASSPSRGFVTEALTDSYQASATGVCPGADDFVVVALAVPFTERDNAKVQIIAQNVSGATGWRIAWSYGLLSADVYDGVGSVLALNAPSAIFDPRAKAGELHAIAMRVRQVGGVTQLSLWVGPARKALLLGANAGVAAASGGTLRVGSGTYFGDEVATDAAVLGLGYYAGTLTDAQMRTLLGRCVADGALPTDVIAWTTAWTGDQFVGVPASVSAAVGTGTLSKQGSPAEIAGFFPSGAGGVLIAGGGGGGGGELLNLDGGTPDDVPVVGIIIDGGSP